jgi:hypothetical protein
MAAAGVPRDDACRSAAIRACCAGGNKAAALQLLDANRAEGRPLTMSTYKAFTKAFGQAALYSASAADIEEGALLDSSYSTAEA